LDQSKNKNKNGNGSPPLNKFQVSLFTAISPLKLPLYCRWMLLDESESESEVSFFTEHMFRVLSFLVEKIVNNGS
jgi:hypothetical protein